MSIPELYAIYLKHPHVTIDSRKVPKGGLFFALKGERVDGNAFAQDAVDQGAAYAIVDAPDLPDHAHFIKVESVLQTLQDLARHHRRQFDIPVVGITGSNGKTTTKELVAEVLGRAHRLHFTPGNYNNHIGVPLTLLAMPADTAIAVIEMGANAQKEIDMLSRIAEPSHGLITNIGKAHLEGFGGIEGVKKGKSELYRFLAEIGGTVFINLEEPFLLHLAAPCKDQVHYRRSKGRPETPFEVQLLREQPFVSVAFQDTETGQTVHADSHLIGLYNFHNISTAVALGQYFSVPAHQIKAAIEHYLPANMRTQILKHGSNTILQDAYNANPTSMANAIRAFRNMKAQKRMLILGDMLELGADSTEEHRAIVELAASLAFDDIVLVGKEFERVARERQLLHFTDVEALKVWFQSADIANTHILIKGSRGIQLERVLEVEE
ncbi:MAG: UDP-N-acetylmuramoyl-tripeptide--D-alanyl-D-alanine ligase [Bacteroidetes bacterium]|jgi:UDP-N-acetylmuramoyl-tripeptide--D-alanyl-D-alanine ligase|nr:UDP-N-acetylmuramoyl-tripeptide--D-alanyl-D-alanine ligase [Bacteroidota bacterium]